MTIKQQATKVIKEALELSKVSNYTFEDYKEDNMFFKPAYDADELFEYGEAQPIQLYSFDAYLAYGYVCTHSIYDPLDDPFTL